MSDNLIIKAVVDNAENTPPAASNLKDTPFPFRPVRCKQADIDGRIQPINGYIYFTLDTQKIYYGTESEFLPMGGSSGIYYANKTFAEEASDDLAFAAEHFLEGSLPTNVNDLIINVGNNEKRNGFYRVVEIFEEDGYVSTAYLPVGGGGGGGSGSVASGEIIIDYVFPESGTDTILIGSDYTLDFNVNAVDNKGDTVPGSGTVTWSIGTKKIATSTVVNGPNSFNIGPYLSAALPGGLNTVKATISMNTGGEINSVQSKIWTIKVINLELEWNHSYDYEHYIKGDTFTISFIPKGNVDAQAYLWIDGNLQAAEKMDIQAYQMGSSKLWTLPSLEYGVHEVSLQLVTEFNGVKFPTETITHKITFISGTNKVPLITVPFFATKANQYDTVKIPFLVYHPDYENVEVSLELNGSVVAKKVCGRGLQDFSHTFGSSGTIVLSIKTVGAAPWEHEVNVAPINLGIEEPGNWKIKLSPSSLFGESDLRAWSENGVNLTFSDNFDFINGGIKSEEYEVEKDGVKLKKERKCILIKKGTSLTINYDPFINNAITNGLTFKFVFKAASCYDYDARILQCLDGRNYGLDIRAQNATFRTSATDDLITQYCEDSLIELELDVWNKDTVSETNRSDNFIMYWVDGVPVNVVTFDTNDNIKHATNYPIIIGSNDCDVYVYLVKIYERHLTEDEHLQNFILDAYSSEEIISRFTRNDIVDPSTGNLSYNLLVKNNPGCHAFVYDIPEMTTSKEHKVGGCSYEHYYSNSEIPDEYASNVEIRVQGTSSAHYGPAAYNIDSKFKDGFNYSGSTQHTDGWSMNKNSIPVNYFCTKVNVASCENANNALNQEWYNRFQPYWDHHRRKQRADNKLARDCMEFIPGVLFIKDRNDVVENEDNSKKNLFWDNKSYMDTPGANRPALQYAICNMGNSKKNTEVFHDEDNPLACCVEVCDNQNAEHWMTKYNENAFDEVVIGYKDGKPITEGPFYEFRYPDEDNYDYTEKKSQFMRLVKWFADNNPGAATDLPLPESLSEEQRTFEPYTFKGPDSPSPTGISLKGLTISNYSTWKNEVVKHEDGSESIERVNYPYTEDTYEYRMAKMLSECEQYLIMDSIVYHYLFIERHTMVDNVAKNTFWSTEDGQHWDLTKNYDNDTADGNNNTGFLVFSYGKEVGDKDGGLDVFNAMKSVWLVFIEGLYEARKNLYIQLRDIHAWDPTAYLNDFINFQSVIPERCWIQDYMRKYVRPRRLGLDSGSFLKRLEGGRKTHQRKQFETYQDIYYNSKYQIPSSNIDLRLNAGQIPEDASITLSYYIDCYAYANIGGQIHHKRIHRGDEEVIPIAEKITNASDSTCYFYYDYMVQALKGVGRLLPTYFGGGNAKRLRVIDIGTTADRPNTIMTDLSFSGNTMLENIEAQYVGHEQGLKVLSLVDLKALSDIDITGSRIKGVYFADGGNLTNAYLNDINVLQATNLNKIKNFTVEKNREDTSHYALDTISIINTPKINSYDLVLNSNNLTFYRLEGVNWVVPESGLNLDGSKNLTSIKVLEHLLRPGCLPSTENTATSLTGTITINAPGVVVDEFAIYKKYNKVFPNVEIKYSSTMTNTVQKAKVITFYKDDVSDEILFRVLTDGTLTIAQLTSGGADSPTSLKMGAPNKVSTDKDTFIWDPEDEDPDWLVTTASSEVGNKRLHSDVLTMTPTEDTTFTPIFKSVARAFKVILRDMDGTDLVDESFEAVAFEQKVKLPTYLYKAHTDASKRYDFQGWISSIDYFGGNKNPNFVANMDSPEITVTADVFLYAFYREVDATTPMPLKYFVVTDANKTALFTQNLSFVPKQAAVLVPELAKYSKDTGIDWFQPYWNVYLKEDVVSRIKGKIIIPKILEQNKPACLSAPYGFGGIEEIDFEPNSTYEMFCSSIFNANNAPHLKSLHLPDSLKYIGANCFMGSTSLTSLTWSDNVSLEIIDGNAFQNCSNLALNALPDTLKFVGLGCFIGANKVTLTKLPSQLKILYRFNFVSMPSLNVPTFGTDNEDEGLQILWSRCADLNGGSITIGKSITHVAAGADIDSMFSKGNYDFSSIAAFGKYGDKTLSTIIIDKPLEDFRYGSKGALGSELLAKPEVQNYFTNKGWTITDNADDFFLQLFFSEDILSTPGLEIQAVTDSNSDLGG